MNKKYILLTIISVLVIIIGATFAWLTYQSRNTSLVLTIGNVDDVMVTLSPYKLEKSLVPAVTYTGEPYTQINVVNNSETTDTELRLFYSVNSIGSGLQNENFQYSVNLQFDINNIEKIKEYIPTKDGCELLRSYLNSIIYGKNRATTLIGPYGKGKSHLLLVLITLLDDYEKEDIPYIDFPISPTIFPS